MAAIIGGLGCAEPASENPAWRRGQGASSHTLFFGHFQKKANKTHFTGHQHGRLELMEQDFVHGEIACKHAKQVPAGIVEDLSHVRLHSPPPKEKLLEAPPALGSSKQSPAVFGGFAAHNHEDPKVAAKHLLWPQKTFRWMESMASHASLEGKYQFRARTPRQIRRPDGWQPPPLSSLRPLADDTLGDTTTREKSAPPLNSESHMGNLELPQQWLHQDVMQTFPKHEGGTEKLSRKLDQDGTQKLSPRIQSKRAPQKPSRQKLSQLSAPKHVSPRPKWRVKGNLALGC